DNFKTRLAAFKLEGDALSWWKAHLRNQVRGDAFADTCTWVAFREIFYNRTGDRVNRRSGVAMTRVSMCIGVVRTRVLSIGVVEIEDQRSTGRNGNDRQGQGIYNQRQHRNQST
nr:zinc finger, CCHC-type, retrotransposon Gag domain protein [Tanacetum cinerariifolium]